MQAEPIAIAFANTRSSSNHDRIATLAEWRAWVDAWPGLRSAGHAVDVEGLLTLRTIRDDLQLFLRSAVGGGPRELGPATRLLELTRSPANLDLRWQAGRPTLAIPKDAAPSTVIAQHLTHAALDLLLTGPPLAVCVGRDCLKLFVASRPDRRWCDSTICGNRARVRAHSRRQHARQSTTLGEEGNTTR